MEDNKYLIDYYNQDSEDERLSDKCGSVEFLTTMRYIEKYLKPDDRILEIGAGTGRYSHALAQKGYSVDAVELIEHNIKRFKENTTEGEKITITQGNALDLSVFADETYDITLLLGPMYHLYTESDKQTALSEAIRVTKKSGLIFVAYCISDATIIREFFVLKRFDVFEYIKSGKINPETFATQSSPVDIIELVRKEDIDKLITGFDVNRLHYVATDGMTHHLDGAIDEMDEALFDMYLKYHYATCERPDMVGQTHHSLDILKKNK
jgi:SAM-dependent methyltransferase